MGVCPGIERARAKALTDLVEGNATIEAMVTLTVAAPSVAGAPEPPPPAPNSRTATAARRVVDPAPHAPAQSRRGTGGTATDLVEVSGLTPGEPSVIERRWLERAVASTRTDGHDRRGRARIIACDRVTGGLADPDGSLATGAYLPRTELRAPVKARDGRCRFPGCHVAARFTDLDHVRPWPAGPTAATNLICLCRRHHRIKQRARWTAVLAPDASLTWTDPTGRTRVTNPVDALHSLTLHATPEEPTQSAASCSTSRSVLPDAPHSTLEFTLEHHVGDQWRGTPAPIEQRAPATTYRVHHPPTQRNCRGGPRRARPTTSDPPPF